MKRKNREFYGKESTKESCHTPLLNKLCKKTAYSFPLEAQKVHQNSIFFSNFSHGSERSQSTFFARKSLCSKIDVLRMKEMLENHPGKEDSQATRKRAVRVLIVTDKLQDVPSLLRCLCHLRGIVVESKHAGNLPQALYRLRNERFDLIFLDDGFNSDANAKGVLETFQECKIHVPVVIITTEDNEPAVHQLLKAGAYGFISRNDLETQVFIETIKKALGMSAVLDEQRD